MLRRIILAGCLVTSLTLSAQIDKANITVTSDTTFVRQNSTGWVFYADTLTMTLPNGKVKPIPVFQADLVTWQDGKRSVTLSTGAMTWNEFAKYGRTEIEARNSEIAKIMDNLTKVRGYRDSWVDFIKKNRAR